MDLTPDQSATLDSFLSPGEKVLWTGRPDTRIRFGLQDLLLIPTGLLLLAVLVLVIVFTFARSPRVGAVLAIACLPGAALLLPMYLARPWLNARQRSRRVYAVTDRRAIIMHGSRRIVGIDLATIAKVSLRESRDGTGTITFGPFNPFALVTPVFVPAFFPVFESLPDARRVFELIAQTRQAARAATPSSLEHDAFTPSPGTPGEGGGGGSSR